MDANSAPSDGNAEPAATRLAGTPFSRSLGVDILHVGNGRATLALDIAPQHTNLRGAAHGGVLATLADMALSLAYRGTEADLVPAGTLSLNVNFIAPAMGRVTAHGRLQDMTGGCAFCEARIVDDRETLVATAQGVFRFRTTKPSDVPAESSGEPI